MFKKFNCITGQSNNYQTGGSNITSQDYFALFAEKEVHASNPNSTTNEANALTAITYYRTTTRIKTMNGSAYGWWERSPAYYNDTDECLASSSGTPTNYYVIGNYGLSPFGCL